jgi:hypothetical protein
MPDSDHFHDDTLFFDLVDDPIVSHSETPVGGEVTDESFAPIRIFRKDGFDLMEDSALPGFIDLFEIFDDFVVDEDLIAQEPSPALRG